MTRCYQNLAVEKKYMYLIVSGFKTHIELFMLIRHWFSKLNYLFSIVYFTLWLCVSDASGCYELLMHACTKNITLNGQFR